MMRGFLKWLNLSSAYSLPTHLLMALVLVFASNSAFAAMSCSNSDRTGYSSPGPACAYIQQAYTNNTVTLIPTYWYGDNWQCLKQGTTNNYGGVVCSGTCINGMTPNASSNYTCECPSGKHLVSGQCVADVVTDDCSTNLATMGTDLSGSNVDGVCGCPSNTEMVNAGTSSVSCASPCPTGTHRTGATCANNCENGFTWDNAKSVCSCDGYPGELNGVLTCIAASNSQLGGIEQNTKDAKAAIDAVGAKQDVTNNNLTSIQNQNTTIINGQAQQLSAMGATAASAASTATSSAAGAVSSATTASNTATISAATQATNTKLDTTNAGLADLAAGIGAANQTLTAIKGSLSGTVTQGEQGTFTAPSTAEENALRTALNARYTEITTGLTQIFTPPELEGNSGLPCYRNIPLFDDYHFDICLADYEDEMSVIPAFIYGFGIFLGAFIVMGGAKND